MAVRPGHEESTQMNTRPNIVLIHGAWADGSCWSGVIEQLQADGYDQAIPPDAERQFAARMGATTVETPSSHVPMGSRPGDVAQLIKTAAETAPATS